MSNPDSRVEGEENVSNGLKMDETGDLKPGRPVRTRRMINSLLWSIVLLRAQKPTIFGL